MLLDKSFVGVYQPTPVSLFEDFRALLWSRNAAPRQPGWHKASSPAFVYTGHDSRETNPRRAGQEYQGHLPGLHRAESHLLLCPKCVDTACWNLLAVWFSSGDATNMDEIHRLTRVTARGLHLPRQAFNTDTDRGPKGKGRLMRVCGLRRLESPTIERVRRAPARGSGVATTRTRRTTPSSFLA